MAVWLRGHVSLGTRPLSPTAMLYSGEVLNFSNLPGKGSISTPPAGSETKLRSFSRPSSPPGGLIVPMISGRGLGHTGGHARQTRSHSGFNVNLSLTQFRHVLKSAAWA